MSREDTDVHVGVPLPKSPLISQQPTISDTSCDPAVPPSNLQEQLQSHPEESHATAEMYSSNRRRIRNPHQPKKRWNSAHIKCSILVILVTFLLCIYNVFVVFEKLGQLSYADPTKILGPCAINFYGLPRKFHDIVFPGVVENVIRPNARYQCDYFVHYYDKKEELDYRGADKNHGGKINPDEIKLLRDAVIEEHKSNPFYRPKSKDDMPTVKFIKETEEEFFSKYNQLIDRIHSEKGADGKPLFMPMNEKKPFPNVTITNIFKMWHSQEAVWNLMEEHSQSTYEQQKEGPAPPYSRVAMLRSDVLFVTPIDIYELPDGTKDQDNKFAIIPGFGKFPVNDRMIYGPVDAIRIWAAGKFRRLREHAERIAIVKPGDGIHPERFLHHTIFPAIRDSGVEVLSFPPEELCFLRVRSDDSVRAGDCGRKCVSTENREFVEHLIQRPCIMNTSNPDVTFYICNDEVKSASTQKMFPGEAWKGCPWKP